MQRISGSADRGVWMNEQRILIDNAPFTKRAVNALHRLSVNYLDEVCQFTALELLGRSQFGKHTLREARKVLAMYGLSLRGDIICDSEGDKKLIQEIPNTLRNIEWDIKKICERLKYVADQLDQLHANMQPINRNV